MALSLQGLCHQLAHGGLAQRLQPGSTARHRPAPAHPQDPQPRLSSWGLLQGLCTWAFPPRGASRADLAPRPQTLLAWSGSAATSLSWAWVPRRLSLRVPLTAICLGCHGLPHAQEQGPGAPEADSPTARPGRLHTAALHDDCSCPHPPTLGSPSKRPLFPGPPQSGGGPLG